MNLILILILVHCLGALVFSKKNNCVYCGLFGYLGKSADFSKLTILGMFNDSRGGDSVGLFVDSTGCLYSDNNKNKTYSEFVSEEYPYDKIKPGYEAILGHCRKASVGGIGARQAQPCIVVGDDNYIKFAMIHNGTLTNYKELIKKYNVTVDDKDTDSQQFCKLVYQEGFDVLGEYKGAGAFVFYDYRTDDIHLFKGKSKSLEHEEAKEERPFYIYKADDGIYFSSMINSLCAIGASIKKEVLDTKCNVLYKYNKEKKALLSVKEYDRTSIYANEYVMPYRGGYSNTVYYNQSDDLPFERYKKRQYVDVIKGVRGNGGVEYKSFLSIGADMTYEIDGEKMNGKYYISDYGYLNPTAGAGAYYYFINGHLLKGEAFYDIALYAKENLCTPEDSPTDLLYLILPFLYNPIFVNGKYQKSESSLSPRNFTGVIKPMFSQLDRCEYTINNGAITSKIELDSPATTAKMDYLSKTVRESKICNEYNKIKSLKITEEEQKKKLESLYLIILKEYIK